jgi:hypothetical protein
LVQAPTEGQQTTVFQTQNTRKDDPMKAQAFRNATIAAASLAFLLILFSRLSASADDGDRSGAPTINNEALTGRSTRDDDERAQINFVQGKIAFEFVGQATSFAPTPEAPLGSAHQYGFLTVVPGIHNVFSGSPHNETTALLTFFNEVSTTESFTDGPLRIFDRNGTTTIYLNTAPASFANPDSFRSGIPIQTSTLHQQAVNTAGGTFTPFTAVFANTISSTSAFTINGTTFRLGETGQAFQATVTGQGNATPPPNGHFSGYAVGAGHSF